jgi:non-ribosomal peptide synthetase component F/NRPS condensation-like uncharacterized protein
VRALRELIALCRSARAHCYTPSDFPLASITQEQLDNLVEGRPSAAPDHLLSAAAHAQIEDIYPLSPVQQGMYFHCLSAQPGAYVEQTNCVLRGMVNAVSLERAWQTLIERHSILRTSFHLADMDAPLQVVHRTSGLNFRLVEHDLSWMPQEEQERWIADYLAADLKRGFDLSRAPLLRVALARLDARLYRFVLTFHHLLLDGWSAARLFKEVLSLYHGGNGGQEAVAAQPISPGRPFRDYIAWLQRQDLGEAENFWRTVLKGFRTPTPIGESQSYGADARLAPSGYGDKQCVLPASTTRNLQDYARNHQLTLNTMVQGVWALILARHSRTFDVLFGVTVSGRPVELEGVESMLGMFINTLPVRVRMPGARRAVDWLKQIQAEQVEMRQYEYTPLGIVQRWSGAPAGGGLFESLLVFENYPMSAVAREQEGGVRIEAVESSTRTKYSLTLVVSPGAELGLYLAYDRRRFSDESIEKILQEIGETLEVICKGGQELFLSALLQGNEADWVSDREPARDELDAGESIDPPHAPITLPRTVTEEKLAALWAEVMGLDRIDVHGNFFELGGHSLLATQVISRVRATFHGGIALRSLFEYPTVAQLAQHIEEVMRADRSPKAPRLTRVSGDRTRLPLSFAQQRLWILQQLDPLSVAYNIPVAVRLRGHLDFTALQRTFDEIIRRHEALRTTFESRQGEPAQVISEAAPSRITFVDLRGGDEARAEAEIRTMVKAEAARPFDLTSGPLLRTILVSKSEQEHVALLNMHHIISDEWSTNILIREVSALYAAFAHGEPSPLPELEAQYGDYAVWQRDWLKGRALEEQLDYWRRQLNGASMLRLPLDRERSASHIRKGATEEFHLGAEETLRLNELSQAEGCTLFMSVLAAFQTLLHRYSGQDDVVIGADIANRTCPEIEPLIGFFVNQLALRVDFSGNPKFRELMRRTRKVVLEAYEHQDVSFDKVVEVLRLERDLSRAPLFQVKLVFQNTPRGTLQLPGLRLEELDIESGSTRLDLIFYMRETEDGLRGALRYDAALFDASTIKRMLEHFGSILKEAIADPDLPVKFIEMRSEAEKRRQAEEERRREASNLKKLKKIRSISATRKVDPLR